MRDIKMTEIIGRSMTRASKILFEPFSIKKWNKLIFIAMFAGSLFSFPNMPNFPTSPAAPNPSAPAMPAAPAAVTPSSQSDAPAEGELAISNSDSEYSEDDETPLSNPVSGPQRTFVTPTNPVNPQVSWAIGIALFVVMAIFMLLFMWLNSRFKFIWFHAVATREISVVEPFHRHRREGNSLFKASLVFSVVALLFVASFAALFAVLAKQEGAFEPGFVWSAAAFMKILGLPGILFLGLFLIGLVIMVMIDAFVIPVMALDKISFLPAFGKVWGIFKENAGDVFLFYVVSFFLSIFCGILILIALIGTFVVFAFLGAFIFGLGYLIFMSAMKAQALFIAYCVVLGIPFVTALICLCVAVPLPFAVFSCGF